eukprot:comp21570_c0_seq1/m.30131 comp21570_c0_seq1/g.30131  ORF comp21570_c0_seq1/g.30131 comp21570_c0_seq1/m.30131 type:complete len:347 (-) comp21570_c0_seq1:2665-3705(-)
MNRGQGKLKESNIQVVVRCRGRANNETEKNATVVVSCNKDKKNTVEVLCTNSTTKRFTYDKVFGPQATQAEVYSEVAKDMLDEVLKGYICTLFAYGQTGTGKTYTMAGQFSGDGESRMGPHAGIIPRVLTELFDTLETDTKEFSVRVSFAELYNEELRDLLAVDDKKTPQAAQRQIGPSQGRQPGRGTCDQQGGRLQRSGQGHTHAPSGCYKFERIFKSLPLGVHHHRTHQRDERKRRGTNQDWQAQPSRPCRLREHWQVRCHQPTGKRGRQHQPITSDPGPGYQLSGRTCPPHTLQREQADTPTPRLTRWQSQDVHHSHNLSYGKLRGGDPEYAGIRPQGKEYQE